MRARWQIEGMQGYYKLQGNFLLQQLILLRLTIYLLTTIYTSHQDCIYSLYYI